MSDAAAAAGPAALIAAAYALGTFPTAVLVARRRGHDVLGEGSGNPGATNVYRLAGRKAAAKVFAGDFLKGAIPTLVGALLDHQRGRLALAMGAAAVLGHCLPATRRFKGGKGVATAGGFAAVVEPVVTIGAAVLWLATVKLAKKSSVASLVVAIAAPVAVFIYRGLSDESVTLAAVALFVVSRHWRNISRLLRGEESSLPGKAG